MKSRDILSPEKSDNLQIQYTQQCLSYCLENFLDKLVLLNYCARYSL